MASIAFGVFLVVLGAAGAFLANRIVERAARVWPREPTRGDVAAFVSTSFMIRMVSILLLIAGALILVLAV